MNVVIVGGGEVGTYLASLLLQGSHHVQIIEQREDEVCLLYTSDAADE